MTLDLDDRYINALQRKSIVELVNRAKHANTVDICMRIGGKDIRIEADWLKHLQFAAAAHQPGEGE